MEEIKTNISHEELKKFTENVRREKMKCENCQKIIELKEKTAEKQFSKLLGLIAWAEGDKASNYFKQCLDYAENKNGT